MEENLSIVLPLVENNVNTLTIAYIFWIKYYVVRMFGQFHFENFLVFWKDTDEEIF